MAAARPLGVGVLGATGNIGRKYRAELREIPEQARIVALCARRRERLQRARDEDGAVLITRDWREVVAHPEVHVVLIATPDDQHLEPALACAAAGRHLICEKPVARTAAEAVAIREAFRDSGLGHFVPFWSRYEPPLARARALIADGAVGRVRWFTYRRHMPRTAGSAFAWRDDAAVSTAGAVADLGVHMIDVLRWMLGEEPRRVLAHGQVLESSKPYAGELDMQEAEACTEADEARRPTAWDHGTVLVELSGGIAGVLMTSESARVRGGLSPELEVHGDTASLAADSTTGRIELLRGGGPPQVETVATDAGVNRFGSYVLPALRERAAAPAGAAFGHPGLDDGVHAARYVDACLQSARSGAWERVEAPRTGDGESPA